MALFRCPARARKKSARQHQLPCRVETFFRDARPAPKTAPGKDAARARIIALRVRGYSIDEIAAALAGVDVGLNRTGTNEVITEAGLPPLRVRVTSPPE